MEVIEPDPPFPCPNKSAVYECTVEGLVIILTWVLPPDMTELGFNLLENPGINKSSGTFTAFLNRFGIIVVGSVISITSTLQIQHLDNLNGSSLTCEGVPSSGDRVDRMVTISVSGES